MYYIYIYIYIYRERERAREIYVAALQHELIPVSQIPVSRTINRSREEDAWDDKPSEHQIGVEGSFCCWIAWQKLSWPPPILGALLTALGSLALISVLAAR